MNQLPAYLQNRPSRGLAQRVSENLGTSSPPYLSLKDNRFTLVDAAGNQQAIPTYEMDPAKCMRGQSPGPYADVMIIDVNDHLSRIYYEEGYDPTASSYQPPPCFSHNGIGPSKQSSKPQSPTCAACPQAVWGSATSNVSGKGIPACAQYQMIAVQVAGHETPFLLRIPPNSLKNYRAYAEQFRGQAFDMDNVLTRLSFVSQGTLAFIPANWAPEAMLASADKLVSAKATDSMVGRLDAPIQGMLPAPAAEAPQTLPFDASAAAPPAQAFAPAPATSAPAAQSGGATPASTPAPRGRGRPKATPQPATPAPGGQAQAPFMPAPGPASPAESGGAAFGMGAGVPPNAEVAGMLDNLFGKQ